MLTASRIRAAAFGQKDKLPASPVDARKLPRGGINTRANSNGPSIMKSNRQPMPSPSQNSNVLFSRKC
jgi:hypothetical protein